MITNRSAFLTVLLAVFLCLINAPSARADVKGHWEGFGMFYQGKQPLPAKYTYDWDNDKWQTMPAGFRLIQRATYALDLDGDEDNLGGEISIQVTFAVPNLGNAGPGPAARYSTKGDFDPVSRVAGISFVKEITARAAKTIPLNTKARYDYVYSRDGEYEYLRQLYGRYLISPV